MVNNPRELISVLQCRWNVLLALRDGPRSKPELIDECDISRSTVDRAIDDLVEHDLCRREFGRGYRLTPHGRCAVNLDETVSDSLEGLGEARSAGLQVSMDEPGVGVMFADAEIVTSEPPSPDRPLREFCKRLRETPRLRGFTPVVLQEFVEIGVDRLRNETFSLDLLVSSAVSEYLATEYPHEFAEDLSSDRASFHEVTLPESTGLGLLGGDVNLSAALLSYGDGGLRGFVETENRLAVGWAERLYTELKAEATPIKPMEPI